MKSKMKVIGGNGSYKAFSIIELSVVLAILLAMTGIVSMSLSGIKKWRLAKFAGEELRVVYIAQKTYLADHPTEDPVNFTETKLLPYMSTGVSAIPQVENYAGNMLDITLTVMPPTLAGDYDLSANTDDGLWDVGKP